VDIVLGVSMTPTTVRMVLVEGEKADGVTVDHDVFDITAVEGGATTSASDQVVAAVLGTQESAVAGGHHLKSMGVTWTDHGEAAALRDTLAARGIEDVMLVSELHAAAALAQAAGRAVGYDTTALLFIDRDTATLSVVQTDDGSVVKVLSQSLHSADAMAVLTEMAAAVDAQDSRPQGMFVVGSGVDVTSVKAHLEHLVALPVNAPEEPELALARGAALASANAPAFEASTVGLAYSQDPDGTTAASVYPAAFSAAATQMAPVSEPAALVDDDVELTADEEPQDESRKPFLLVGSALTSIFVVGVVALVISLAVSIRPTVDQRPSPGQSAIVPSSQAPAPFVQEAQPVDQPPPAATIKDPVPVVQQSPQAPPRTVFVEQPPAPAPAAPPPAPEAPPPAPIAPPPPPAYTPPPVYNPPVYNPPVYNPPVYNPPIWPPIWQPPVQNPPPWQPPVQNPPPWQPPVQNPPPWKPPVQDPPPWKPPVQDPGSQQPQQPPPSSQVPQVPNGQPPSGSGGSGSAGAGSGGSGSSGSGSGGSGSAGSGSGGSGSSGGSTSQCQFLFGCGH
jgi:uncharacterized membrane protein YgcG